MSGLVGHTMYGILAAKAADEKQLAIAPVLRRHFASYLTGAYIGCDVQTMPQAICADTGRQVGYGTVTLEKSPLTGGPVLPWFLEHEGRKYSPKEIHDLFYGRSHLVFGWVADEKHLAVPWDHLHDYCALAVSDLLEQRGSSERALAYLFGWMAHIVSDSLIKSIRPGIRMRLLDGAYTPRNRPIQDLFVFHKIGIEQFHMRWDSLFHDMAATPVEPIQLHYMRIDEDRGRLAEVFAEGWRPDQRGLLQAVLVENRRWLPHHAGDVLEAMTLTPGKDGLEVSAAVKSAVGDLSYSQMIDMAERSQMRKTLATITAECINLFERVIARIPQAAAWPADAGPGWDEMLKRWAA